MGALLAGAVALGLLAGAGSGGSAAREQIPGQKRPLVIVGDTFRFVEGSWARYVVDDLQTGETYRMTMAVLEKGRKKSTVGRWMEVDVRMPGQPGVATRFLVTETAQGPGELLEAIVQVEGMTPFSVPGRFLKAGNDQKVAPLKPAKLVRQSTEKISIPHRDGAIEAWAVDAETAEGERVQATVSLELPPITLYEATTREMRMKAEDWGLGARSAIRGEPQSFYIWLLEQVAKGMEEPQPAPRP
jgi:hypothetical protein